MILKVGPPVDPPIAILVMLNTSINPGNFRVGVVDFIGGNLIQD